MLMDLGGFAPFAAIGLMAAVFVTFLSERFSADMVAFVGAAVALALGLVDAGDITKAIGNPAPATIGVMFLLSAALVRTGALEMLVEGMGRMSRDRPTLTVVVFFTGAAVASAFLNNTPVVMVLIPVAIGLAREIGTVPSRLLMPLSFMVILGVP